MINFIIMLTDMRRPTSHTTFSFGESRETTRVDETRAQFRMLHLFPETPLHKLGELECPFSIKANPQLYTFFLRYFKQFILSVPGE